MNHTGNIHTQIHWEIQKVIDEHRLGLHRETQHQDQWEDTEIKR